MRIRLLVQDRQKALKAKQLEEYHQTPEGQAERALEMERQVLLDRRRMARLVCEGKKPGLGDARQDRADAMKALGGDGLARWVPPLPFCFMCGIF
jgi:hypothetical protein